MPLFRFYCVICGTSMKAPAETTDDIIECPNCARVVPVPRFTSLSGQMTGCGPAFPPEVLDLEVKFLCTACKSRLRADARWEGRGIVCPVCAEKVRVPRWSDVSRWSAAPGEKPAPAGRVPAPAGRVPASADAAAVSLSREEIEFLSEAAPTRQAAAS